VVTSEFRIGRLPEVVFGPGTRVRIPEIASSFGRRLLLVTGASSLRRSRHWVPLADAMAARKLVWLTLVVADEPSPSIVDDAVREHRGSALDAVIGIGGGSVLDAAKAIAGLLPSGHSVMDHLEEVGAGVPYAGPALPLILAPTTAGTGSEATRNAVLSMRGRDGFKRSFRDERLIARYAVVDPDLLETCPKALVAADGMDALTQLVESYVSLGSTPFTDALSESGLAACRDGLLAWYAGDEDSGAARARMAWAALVSGIALAHAGLGAVHGLASPLGAYFAAPHGAACGTLLAEVTRANVSALRSRHPDHPALERYARIWEILSGATPAETTRARAARRTKPPERLVALLEDWTARLELPGLGRWGVTAEDLPRITAGCRAGSMRTNPVVLDDGELIGTMERRLGKEGRR